MGEELIIDIDFDTTDGRSRRWNHLFNRLDRLETLMTTDAQGLTDEQAAVTALTTVVTDVVTALQALENEVSTLQAQGTVDPAALEAITTSLNGLGTQLNNALPAAPAEPPADPTAS